MGRGVAPPLYKLADALAARRVAGALQVMAGLLDEGEPALRILATLHRSVRQVRGAKALSGRRVSRDEVARRLQIPPFKVGDMLAAAGRWSEADLSRALRALGQADRDVKTGAAAEVALTAAVAEACRASGSRALVVATRPWPRPGR